MIRQRIVIWCLAGALLFSGCQGPLTTGKTGGFSLTLHLSEPGLQASTNARLLLKTAKTVSVSITKDSQEVAQQTVAVVGTSATVSFQLPVLNTYVITATAKDAAGVLLFAGSTTTQLLQSTSGTLSLLPVDAKGSLSSWPLVTPASQPQGGSVPQGLTLNGGKNTSFLVDFSSTGSAFTFAPLTGDLELYAQSVAGGFPVAIGSSRTIDRSASPSGLWVTYFAPTTNQSLTTLGRFSVPVNGVSSDTAVSLTTGQTKVLAFTVTPANADNQSLADFTWTSADATVASVDAGGKVTAWKSGATTVTVASKLVPSVSSTVNVTVTVALFPVTSVGISPTTVWLAPGATTTLTATVLPANATNPAVTWSSGATGVATVDAATGLVTAVNPGTATITVTTQEGGKTATATVNVAGPEKDQLSALAFTLDGQPVAFSLDPTGNAFAWTAASVAPTQSYTFTPTQGLSGQTISYSTDGTTFTPLASGTTSPTQTLVAGANSLWVRVLAPDGTQRDYVGTITKTVLPYKLLVWNQGLWEPLGTNAPVGTVAIAGSVNHLVALTAGGQLWDDVDGLWSRSQPDAPAGVQWLTFGPAQTLYGASPSGLYTLSGGVWRLVAAGPGVPLKGLATLQDAVLGLGTDGVFYRYDTSAWSPSPVPVPAGLVLVAGADGLMATTATTLELFEAPLWLPAGEAPAYTKSLTRAFGSVVALIVQ